MVGVEVDVILAILGEDDVDRDLPSKTTVPAVAIHAPRNYLPLSTTAYAIADLIGP